MPQRLSQKWHFAFFEGGVFFCNGFLRPFPWIYTCCQDKEEGGMEACNVGIKLTLTSLQFASPHSHTCVHTHWHAQHTLALGGAELRMEHSFGSRNVVWLKFPAIKTWLGRYPLKCVRKEPSGCQLRKNEEANKRRRRAAAEFDGREMLEHEGWGRDIFFADHWLPCHSLVKKQKNILAPFAFSRAPLFFSNPVFI